MQALDLACNSSLDPSATDRTTMSEASSPIRSSENPENPNTHVENNCVQNIKEDNVKNSSRSNNVVIRRERPSRACTQRAAARLQAAAEAEAVMAEAERKRKKTKRRERLAARLLKELSDEEEGVGQEEEEEEEEQDGEENGCLSSLQQCSKIVTPLVGEPEPSQLQRWTIRSMWQLASILNFLNVFRHLLNIKVEFSPEEFETALIMPNNTLGDIHIPLLKAIPPVTRMALGHGTWITVLCRKLRDWWHWVADGDIPIVASHGAEIEAYSALDPSVRVVILKALCDIRVEQEDVRSFIDDSIKHGVPLSVFRKERLGGDSHGISYWYEDDPIIGQRLYREIRKVEVKRGKGKSIPPIPPSCYQWEAVATNLDEFQNVSEKLFSSKNRTEVSVGKKLKKDMLPEVEKVHKRKERLLKKQHRQALMLDNLINIDGLGAGRSLRDRKPVTYTFDDYDRSINEAIQVTKKKHPSPEPLDGTDPHVKHEVSTNGGWVGPSQYSRHASFGSLSPKSPDNDEFYDDHEAETLDYSNRRRQRPQKLEEFVEAVSDNEVDSDSDDDIVGEVVYDEEYLRKRKQRKTSSSSEGDEEYIGDEENPEEEEDILSTSEESDEPHKYKNKMLPSRTRRETKLRSVDELQSGLRRSKRATRTRIDYRQIEMSESETELMKPEKSNALDEHPTASDNEEFSTGSRDSDSSNEKLEMHVDQPAEEHPETNDEQTHPPEKSNETDRDKVGVPKKHFLDLNELAPGSGFDDIPNSMKDEDKDNF
ncbi:DDT domain-containing protein DDR4-like isoform X1 [Olea europaea var. sylvestris]|uniref:DDT domain-containing protein DDR4-like isoform X1 n=1 Tax=Olea europaea var. sylvestris TaxID=158386 RepID=UPI000C1D1C5C|nr:DDT domain-containing protein DDR4-like isoform X1 [Olea europaea var. sylvestris]